MGFRPCFSNLPLDQRDLPDGPRQGNLSRSGYEVAWDAAGNPFPKGERDDRALLTVDDLPQKRKNCLNSFDRTGVAGCGSPRDEVRAFTIDDHNRRARSEPPQPQLVRAAQLQSMQVFGVPLDIDNGLCGRRQRCDVEPSEPTRQQDAERAMRFGDINGVLAKRHFVGNRGPRELLNPRLENIALESIDIDSCARRRKPMAKTAADTILPTSACYSLACEVNHGAWRQAPRSHSFDYFEKTLQAERYAKLLGRPNIESDKEFKRACLASAMLEQRQKTKNGETCSALDTIADSDEFEEEADESVDLQSDVGTCLSAMSTTASDVPCSELMERHRLSIVKELRHNSSDAIGKCSQEETLPLNLRRVVASLGAHSAQMLSDDVVRDLKHAVSSSAKNSQNAQRANCKGKASIGARLRASSRNRIKA